MTTAAELVRIADYANVINGVWTLNHSLLVDTQAFERNDTEPTINLDGIERVNGPITVRFYQYDFALELVCLYLRPNRSPRSRF